MDSVEKKALELYNKFPLGNRKKSAIICVDEILNIIYTTKESIFWNKVKAYIIENIGIDSGLNNQLTNL